MEKDRRLETRNQLFKMWSGSEFTEDPKRIAAIVKIIFSTDRRKVSAPFNLHLKGTNFQVNVWRALLRIPEGWVVSYKDIASHMGHPKAFRAVGNAVAINPVAYLITCHRVIAKSGKIHQYRWGDARKKAIIGWEAARRA